MTGHLITSCVVVFQALYKELVVVCQALYKEKLGNCLRIAMLCALQVGALHDLAKQEEIDELEALADAQAAEAEGGEVVKEGGSRRGSHERTLSKQHGSHKPPEEPLSAANVSTQSEEQIRCALASSRVCRMATVDMKAVTHTLDIQRVA